MYFVSGSTKATVCDEVPLCCVNSWGISDDILSHVFPLYAAVFGLSLDVFFLSGLPLLFRRFSFVALMTRRPSLGGPGDNVVVGFWFVA